MQTSGFWNEFLRHASHWASQIRRGEQGSVFEDIDGLLGRYDLPFCFDITCDDDACQFILSPEGDIAVAAMVDKLVAAAPIIDGWKIFARRQKKPLADAQSIVRNLYPVDLAAAKFRIARGVEETIEMFVPATCDLTQEEGQGLVNTFLWHAIGESVVIDRRLKGKICQGDPPNGTLTAEELVREYS